MHKINYWTRLYQYDKRLFSAVVLFAVLTVGANIAGLETTPFFVWGMYSEKIKPVDNYLLLKTTVNDSVFMDTYAGYSDNTRAFLNAPLAYYRQMKDIRADPEKSFLEKKLKDRYRWPGRLPEQLFNPYPSPGFMPWYACFLENSTGVAVGSLRIDVVSTHFDNDQRLVSDSSYLFEQWSRP